MTNVIENKNQPLASLDEWEDDLLRRYPNPEDIATSKATEAYRNYEEPARDTVKEFYRLNHTHQSFAFVKEKQKDRKDRPAITSFNKIEPFLKILRNSMN